jgi:SulP family sulfate permease
MVVAVSVGVVLAALLFMRRMAEISGAQLFGNTHPRIPVALPENVLLYEIAGPLFFGAAEKAVSAIQSSSISNRIVILDMTAVPSMDVTGLVALETMLAKLRRGQTRVFLAGVQPQPAEILAKSRVKREAGWLEFLPTLEDAVERVILIAPALGAMDAAAPAAAQTSGNPSGGRP